jgi:ATP-dependent helicase/DNAse subunit B
LKELEDEGKGLKILYMEKFFSTEETIGIEGGQLNVKIKGKADRIDSVAKLIKVIDYKTGSVQTSELKIKDWDTLITDPNYGKAFQLLMYAYLFLKDQNARVFTVETGNISLKEPSKGYLRVQLPGDLQVNADTLMIFEKKLVELLEMIYDPSLEFTQTNEVEQCTYCPFKGICSR